MDVAKKLVVSKNQLIEWRRHFHKYPELSFQEEKTSQFVFDILREIPCLEVSRPTKYSVMARLIGSDLVKLLRFVLTWMLFLFMKKMSLTLFLHIRV